MAIEKPLEPEQEKEKTGVKEETLEISGLDCPDCALKIEKAVQKIPGIKNVEVNFSAANMHLEYDETAVPREKIISLVEDFGYGVKTREELKAKPPEEKRPFIFSDPRALTVLISAIPLAIGALIELIAGTNIFSIIFLSIAIAITGYRPARSSITSIKSLVLDMNVLMTVAVIGAIILGQWLEAATVMFLFALGNMLEAYAMDKTRTAIHGLLALTPTEATVKINGKTKSIPVENVEIGSIVVVKPGERIPIDGEVIFGRSSVNQAAVTGESLPITKDVGDIVYAGTINYEGYLEIKSTKRASDTTLARIIHLIEEAQAKKAPTQQFITRFSAYYTPIVIGIAVSVATIPPLLGQPFVNWFYRALVLLVIACPCALVISTPVSIVSAIGAASRNGVLIKGGSYLELAGKINTVVFDKTGTLTTGKLSVTDVISLNEYTDENIIKIAASIEARSLHPVAEAVVSHARHLGIKISEPTSFESLPGLGLRAELNGVKYLIGNLRLFKEVKLPIDDEINSLVNAMQHEGKTVFLLSDETHLIGLIAVADKMREDAKSAVQKLYVSGIKNIVMLTGDNEETAKEIASRVGISNYLSNLLPEDKVAAIDDLSKKYGYIAMVGDGVNDAPAIARADIGIAMAAAGSDIAIENADIALMGDDLNAVSYLINLSKKAVRIIKENIFVSIAVKLSFIVLSVIGLATLWMAVFADTGVALLVILNGLRLFSQNISR